MCLAVYMQVCSYITFQHFILDNTVFHCSIVSESQEVDEVHKLVFNRPGTWSFPPQCWWLIDGGGGGGALEIVYKLICTDTKISQLISFSMFIVLNTSYLVLIHGLLWTKKNKWQHIYNNSLILSIIIKIT